jgi:hypothetical protein
VDPGDANTDEHNMCPDLNMRADGASMSTDQPTSETHVFGAIPRERTGTIALRSALSKPVTPHFRVGGLRDAD